MEYTGELLLGRLAVHLRVITMEQLVALTAEQGRRISPPPIGQLMVELGMANQDDLNRLLTAQRSLAQKRQASHPGTVAHHNPAVPHTHLPVSAPPSFVGFAPSSAAPTIQPAESAVVGLELEPVDEAPVPAGAATQMASLLTDAAAAEASDVHVHAGAAVQVRMLGQLKAQGAPLEAAQTRAMLDSVMTAEQRAVLDDVGEVDFAYTTPGGARFRCNVYQQQRGFDGAFRAIPEEPPLLEELALPSSLAKLTTYHQGLVLITGPAGCGKTATLAALVNIINEERREHILTIEDPIEVVHRSKKCLVNQRQVKRHTESFARALRAALREDPDVIVIGEMRDLETISLALSAAETGHLVLATLHTNSAIRTINRMVGVFPPSQQNQVRAMVSESLRAVVSQRLVTTKDGLGRVPALEVLYVNRAVSNLIRENRTIQIRSILQTGTSQGMCLLEQSLQDMVKSGVVTKEEAMRHMESLPQKRS